MTPKKIIGCYDYEQGILKIDNEEIYFSKLENNIFRVLLDNYGKFVKNEIICKEIYGEEFDESFKYAISVGISRLRKKTKKIIIIKNRRDYGYALKLKKEEI